MQASFLLGPAGSGKTFRCLAGVRAELLARPAGPPLLFLAPKQATFQLERQLLGEGSLAGFTRLHILSFDRLARFVIEQLGAPEPKLLDEEGRLMVLRALLTRKREDLGLYRASARLPGFARHLSSVFREFQRHHLNPGKLNTLAADCEGNPSLQAKLNDLAMLLQSYSGWLKEHELEDADVLLDLAAQVLRKSPGKFLISSLWLDGFAEMTPQELELLAAVLPGCDRTTLAFCLEDVPQKEPSWLSTWSAVGQTFRRCHQRFAALPGCELEVTVLPRQPGRNRFDSQPALQHLERHWARAVASDADPGGLRIVECVDAEAESVFAAREVLTMVRAGQGRYRDCAVLLRSLEGHQDVLRRVFTRYEIPFFLDRRESAAHHPMAELTRSALRLVAHGWTHEDWFASLKTGLVPATEAEVDWLENEALAHGWQGRFWREPVDLPDDPELARRVERLRSQWVPAFADLQESLTTTGTTGSPMVRADQLVAGLRGLWEQLEVHRTLEAWAKKPAATTGQAGTGLAPAAHVTVWEQLQAWLENLERAFRSEAMPLREWLPILEAGLSSLSVGVVPPSLDQVLIGTIDRSRNPELRLALLLGVNEGIFPARPADGTLLTERDRDWLDRHGATLGMGLRQQVGHERYYGYIAATRAREQLIVTYARQGADGAGLNPSPFIAHLQRMFPKLSVGQAASVDVADWMAATHVSELGNRCVRAGLQPLADSVSDGWQELLSASPAAQRLATRLGRFRHATGKEELSRPLAAELYGPVIRTSVSRLEQFAACPFRFFVNSGLRAAERKRFEVDARERGSFQHEVLARFHAELASEQKRWRDVTPTEAQERIGRIADEVAGHYGGGLLTTSDETRFTAKSLKAALQEFIDVMVGWMHHGYELDPVAVELGFGGDGDPLPAWELDLGQGRRMAFRGKIDRVDIAVDQERNRAWCVVVDYKSSARKIDQALLDAGVQIQLPAYLAALQKVADVPGLAGVERLDPAALVYANLNGSPGRNGNRAAALAADGELRAQAYRHSGRLNFTALPVLDSNYLRGAKGTQFNYRVTKDGKPYATGAELKPESEFRALIANVEEALRAMGQDVYEGVAAVDPYRNGSRSACDHCDYRSVCRIDPWTHEFRALRPIADPSSAVNPD